MKPFEKIGMHLSLKERVYESIKSQIIKGKLEPNSHLSEAGLSEVMKISRAPIREALNMLEKEGFVTIIPRKGANVSGISKEEVKNIWEIRSILEPYAARTTALKCQEKELNEIGDKLNKILQEPYDFSDYTNSDVELHELLFKHLKNKMLKEFIGLVKQNVLRILNSSQVKSAFIKKIACRDTREHLMIIEALKAHDPERTEASVYLHIMNSRQRILQALDTHD